MDPDPDPDPYWPPTPSSGSGSVKNEYGSTTLPLKYWFLYSLYILHFYWTRVFFFRIISLSTFFLLFLVTFQLNNRKHRIVEIVYGIGSTPSPSVMALPSLSPNHSLSVTVRGHTKGGGGVELNHMKWKKLLYSFPFSWSTDYSLASQSPKSNRNVLSVFQAACPGWGGKLSPWAFPGIEASWASPPPSGSRHPSHPTTSRPDRGKQTGKGALC